ncbi:MAG: hypothetical protein R2707_11380 [Acidimicrobiales bacterium]
MTQIINISVPRTGSSHLVNHLRAFTGLRVFGEVFNPNQCFSLKSGHFDHIAERWGTRLSPAIDDPDTVAWVRAHPTETLEVLRHFARGRATVVKLFPGHLDRAFVTDSLLPDDDVVALVLLRRVIDSYASAEKARRTRRWRTADTTDLRVEANFDHFVGWSKYQQRWYLDCRDAIAGADRPLNILRYDEHIDRDTGQLLDGLEAMLRANDIDPGPRKEIPWVTPKQDTTRDPGRKFTNWSEFEARLDDAGMLDLATGYFL